MTVVGREAELEGTLVSAESIRIDGQASGTISARGDVILSSQSHVVADIRAQNVVMGGTLTGTITTRSKTELARGGRMEGSIRSKLLVVREGAVFSGQSDLAGEGVQSDPVEPAYLEDDLRIAYGDAARRAAEWYRSRLPGPNAEPDHDRAEGPDARVTS
jgi:cytoskeletal protein CcmA (bactofilin family)